MKKLFNKQQKQFSDYVSSSLDASLGKWNNLRKSAPYIVFLVSMIIVSIVTYILWIESKNDIQTKFAFHSTEIVQHIDKRMIAYETVLRGVSGLFEANGSVDRGEFKRYIAALKLSDYYPGIQGVGYSLKIKPNQKSNHIKKMRAEGFADYVIKPEGERDIFTSIIYLEPFAERNLRAFGYDMYSEPVRRSAMSIACDSAEPHLSGKVKLVQEAEVKIQAGFLMYIPIYKNGLPHSSIQERRENLVGWVYSPFRVDDFMSSLLAEYSSEFDIKIYDSTDVSEKNLMSGIYNVSSDANTDTNYRVRKVIDLAGHQWTTVITGTQNFINLQDTAKPKLIGVFGFLMSIVLTTIAFYFVKRRDRIIKLALGVESIYKTMLIEANDSILLLNLDRKIIEVNDKAIEQFGFSRDEFQNMKIEDLHTENTQAECLSNFASLLTLLSARFDTTYLRKDKSTSISHVSARIVNYDKEDIVLAIITDITERKQTEASLLESEARFRNMADTAPVLIWMSGTDALCYYFSQVWLDFTGRTMVQELGNGWAEGVHPEDFQNCLDIYLDSFKAHRKFKMEYRLRRFDGEYRWVSDIGVPRFTVDGKFLGFIGSCIDISESKEAIGLLQQTQQNYESFFNTINEFLFVLDEQGNIIHNNSTVIDRLEYTKEELIGKSVLMVHPPDRREEAGRIVGEMLSGVTEFCPVPLLTKSGDQIPVETRVKSGFWNGKPAIFGVTKDISQVKLSEEKFSKVFYLNPSAAGLSDLKTGKYIDVNEAFCSLFGFQKEEVINKTAFELGIITESAKIILLQKSASKGKIINAEAELKAKNGEIKQVLLSAENINLQDKEIRYTVVHDITERKKAEEELRKNEEKYHTVADFTYDWEAWRGTDGANKYVSPSCERISGHSAAEFIANPNLMIEITHPDDRQKVLAHYRNADNDGHGLDADFDFRIITTRGEVRWLNHSCTTVNSNDGKWIGRRESNRDITTRKQFEEDLSKSEEKYRLIFEYSPIGLISFNTSGVILACNDNFVKIIGSSRDKLIGLNMLKLPDEKMVSAVLEALNGHNGFYEGIYNSVTAKKITHIRAIFTPIDLEDAEISSGVGIIEDITDRKAAEEEIKLKNAQLIKLNFEKDKFFSIIAHDLRSPFHGFLGYTDILAHDTGSLSDEEVKKIGKSMNKAANNLYNLLKNLLEWSQIQKGTIDFAQIEFQLTSKVAEIIETVSTSCEQKSITLVNLVTEPMQVYADEKMINSVLLNLLSNAVKFTFKGGKITVSATKISAGMIEISVEDSGMGMDESLKEKLFIMGEKVSSKGTEGELSTGLGLLLCKDFVEKNGGNIWVKSENGKGSTFYFTIPAVQIQNKQESAG